MARNGFCTLTKASYTEGFAAAFRVGGTVQETSLSDMFRGQGADFLSVSLYHPLPPLLYLFIYLSVCLTVCPSIDRSIYLSIFVCLCLSFCLLVLLSFCLSVCLPACLPACLAVCLSIIICLYIYGPISLSHLVQFYLILSHLTSFPLNPPTNQPIYLSIFFFFSLSLSTEFSIRWAASLSIFPNLLCLSVYLHLYLYLFHCLPNCLFNYLSICLSMYLSTYLPLYLFTYLSEAIVRRFLRKWKLTDPKWSKSARLPQKMELHSSKTEQLCEASSKLRIWQHQKRSNSTTLLSKMESWVQSWQPHANAFCDFCVPSL